MTRWHNRVAMAEALALTVTKVPAPGTYPDAELLAACAAIGAVERAYLGVYDGPDAIEDDDEREAALEPIEDEEERLVRLICSLRATTLDGHVARAWVVMLDDLELDPDEAAQSSDHNVSLLGALIRDLAEHAEHAVARRAA